jgi:hypothetical protein
MIEDFKLKAFRVVADMRSAKTEEHQGAIA